MEKIKNFVECNLKQVIIAGIGFAVLVAMFFVMFVRSPDGTVKAYVNATFKEDGAKAAMALVPNKVLNDDKTDKFSRSSYISQKKQSIESLHEEIKKEYGEDYKIDHTFIEKKLSEDELKKLKKEFEKKYKLSISDAMDVNVRITVSGKGKSQVRTQELRLVKAGFKWYLSKAY